MEQEELAEAEERAAISPTVVHETIRKEGEEELRRPVSALGWSGLAAGLSMGFSLVAEGLLRDQLPDVSWRPLISKFGYSVGFLIVVLGRQQLFTENTLTAILPLLQNWSLGKLGQVARLWLTVLITNLLGAFLFAWVVGNTDVFNPGTRATFTEIGRAAADHPFWTLLIRGVFAGWLIALMVWLLPAAETAKVSIIVIITFLVGLGEFSHIIAGSVEVLYLVSTGALSFSKYLLGYMVPTLIGNILGGVMLVAALNHAQVVAGKK
ncbi:formate/nitrite transporter family protein [Deinococcus humi]|uniref:Formate/nitrite transporter FocA (FNT family) n=1 Tax=Deinococcus humi TaxID=662880 RepID=A0A7W8JW17_9DEIO|nr:formate/nitrite transporter family protein [Deinococcus humi]MBB5362988.1 formate/nitrite transporter FocA (FNT family) [Deinococcus humi]